MIEMIVKIHKTQEGRKIIAICDKELIGKRFEEGNLQLNLRSDFYNGEEKKEEEIKNLIKDVYIVNLAGEKSIKFGIDMKVVDKKNIIRIKNIPHVQAII